MTRRGGGAKEEEKRKRRRSPSTNERKGPIPYPVRGQKTQRRKTGRIYEGTVERTSYKAKLPKGMGPIEGGEFGSYYVL